MKEEQTEKEPQARPKSLTKTTPTSKGRPKKAIERIPGFDLAPGQAKRIAKARKLSGYSYYELANRSGIPAPVIHRLEEGQLLRGANTSTIFQLAQVLKEDPGWLAFGTGTSLLAEKANKKEP